MRQQRGSGEAAARQQRGDGRRDDAPAPAPEPLAVAVADSHCHLDLVGDDVGAQLDAARAVGVRQVVTIGVDVATSQWSAQVAGEHAGVHAGVAVHPNDVDRIGEDEYAEIARLAALPQVRAVGETGLDYYRDWADPAKQQESFRRHIDIAKSAGKALVIHDRDAHDDVLRILAEEGAPERTVMHCFSGDAEMARACADAGYVMSFAGNVTFASAQQLRAAAAVAPLDLLLVETDAPFLAPVPYRGRRNASYLVPLTVRALAEVKGVSVDELAAAIAATTERTFGSWSGPEA
ncbi:MAG: TatD family hydrolase [Frankiaceae bacterium]